MRAGIADEILTAAVMGAVTAQMAGALIRRGADTRDKAGVIFALASEGFGLPSIKALAKRAVQMARAQTRQGKAVH